MSLYNSTPITQLVPGAGTLVTDVYAAVDVTDLTQSPSGSTKKYTIGQLQSFLVNNFTGDDVKTAYVGTVGNLNASYLPGPNGVFPGIGATLTNAGAFSALVIDGITLAVGQRVLVAFQSNPTQNGVYSVTNAGSLASNWVMTRVPDFDGSTNGEIQQGNFIAVLFGTLNALSWWFLTSPSVSIVGTDPIVFQKQSANFSPAWVNQTTASVTMAVNTGYTSNAGSTPIIYTLPAASSVGAYIQITGKDAGLYTIAQAAGQVIRFGTATSTIGVGGSIASQDAHDAITLTCITANTEWEVTSFVGTFTIV